MTRLFRSQNNRIIGGVCGGLGDYFDLDPVMVRLVWLILILFGGIGLMLYLVSWLLIPIAEEESKPRAKKAPPPGQEGRGRFWWGLALVVAGVYLWGSQFKIIYWPTIPIINIHSRDLVPLILVLVGVYVLYTFGRPTAGHSHASHNIFRSRDDRKIAGVCAGLADYFKVDPTFIRILWVAGAFIYGSALLLYLILWVALPERSLDPEVDPSDV